MIRIVTSIFLAALAGAALADDAGVARRLAAAEEAREVVPPATPPGRAMTVAPLGHAAFCAANRHLCTVSTQRIRPVDIGQIGEITRANAEINAAIAFRFTRSDAWNPSTPAEGDCADVAASKLARLVATGLPREAMRFAVAYTEHGLPHLVLVVWLDTGPLVLDSRRDALLSPRETGYRFVSLEWMWGDAIYAWQPLGGTGGSNVQWP